MHVTQVQLNTLWIGPRLPPLHVACLLSAIRAGHKVRLFCYARPDNLPEEIELADAEEVLKKTDIVRHRKSDSPSLSSNRFRYLLFQKRLGAWIDTDDLNGETNDLHYPANGYGKMGKCFAEKVIAFIKKKPKSKK